MTGSTTDDAIEGTVTDNLPATIKDSPGTIEAKEFDKFLTSQAAEMKEDDGTDAHIRIIQQVLNAETPDAVLTPTEVLKAGDIVGQPMMVLNYRLEKSEFDVGSPFYAVMDVVLGPDQPPTVVTCGHKKVLAQLTRMQQFGAFPFAAEFIERGVSKAGGTAMLELRKVDIQMEEAPF